jgi:hypothetical protein
VHAAAAGATLKHCQAAALGAHLLRQKRVVVVIAIVFVLHVGRRERGRFDARLLFAPSGGARVALMGLLAQLRELLDPLGRKLVRIVAMQNNDAQPLKLSIEVCNRLGTPLGHALVVPLLAPFPHVAVLGRAASLLCRVQLALTRQHLRC